MKRGLLIVSLGLLIASVFLAVLIADPYARSATHYKAKSVCSEVFVAGRDPDDVLARDFDRIHPAVSRTSVELDEAAGIVRGSLLGVLGRAEAVHRPGYGCALAIDGRPVGDVRDRPEVTPSSWPVAIDPDIQALAERFRTSANADVTADIRAVLVVQYGRIIAEDYADGFGPDMPMQSWSMAKSVTQALTAIALDRGLLSLSDSDLMPGWTGDDPRADITVADLLHMADGLDFGEDYGDPASDVTRMLFGSRHMGLSAAQSPSAHAPGTHWAYSSGTTNILSAVLRRAVEASGEDYHDWPYEVLFGPLGMTTPVFETDAGGTFIGSSYLYASPRDWARLGQLYLNDGTWNGRRILPESAVDFAVTPLLPDEAPFYGAHWWLNAALPDGRPRLPGLPDDAYFMGGHDVQRVIVIPSKNAVIVRLGMTRPPVDDDRDVMPGLAAIVDAL
ncbi:serine hydrolase [uncultured Algimonas sp.]|uniref:serine hydrolase domain-containing protein n=1 Tax=uncultured Algimonas sp. TaxID=1547920 RepID=UPI0026157AC8|nr:serine hydrolase [uncultured Algimonas sp.]